MNARAAWFLSTLALLVLLSNGSGQTSRTNTFGGQGPSAEKDSKPADDKEARSRYVSPVIKGYGAVVPVPGGEEPPTKGTKVVFDVTAVNKDPGKPLPGLERAALLLNLAGVTGLKPGEIEIAIVLHGDATSAALNDDAYRELTGNAHPNAELMKLLKDAGVKILVCGQAMAHKNLDAKKVRGEVKVAASALTAVINYQSRGYAFVPAY